MNINFEKGEGFIPVIIQDFTTLEVLMLGYMNEEAYQKTIEENRVTFFSRSKNRLWTKGESSGNYLTVNKIHVDCDQDTLLIFATPNGPTCHTGSKNCFNINNDKSFLFELENIINSRYNYPNQDSYVNKLREKGLNKIVQKVGEEGVETVIAALAESRENLINESSDLLFHLLVLLREKSISLEEIGLNLKNRHAKAK